MDGVVVKCVSGPLRMTTGSAGVTSQVPGAVASVSNLMAADRMQGDADRGRLCPAETDGKVSIKRSYKRGR